MEPRATLDAGWLFNDARPETKLESRDRARKIVRLICAIEDAPTQAEQINWQMDLCLYFVEKANAGELTLNDRDGLQRNIGVIDEEMTAKDNAEMRQDESAWKPLEHGWIGRKVGELYCTKLHPKEIRVLEDVRAELAGDLVALTEAVPTWEQELATLRAVGPLREDIATKHNLTPEGYRKEPKAA